jgi:hypothetical protein
MTQKLSATSSRGPQRRPQERIGSNDSSPDILGCLDAPPSTTLVVHRLYANAVRTEIEAEGSTYRSLRPAGFVTVQDAEHRDRLTGRA